MQIKVDSTRSKGAWPSHLTDSVLLKRFKKT